MPERPAGKVQTLCPDWVCEIVSSSNETNDTITKRRIYFRHRLPHYWLIDPIGGTLSVLRWTPESYVEVLSAQRGQTVRAEPFEALALQVGVLFGDDPDDL
jgi:Uma2 family endonuclease